jgi:hypothetical protein
LQYGAYFLLIASGHRYCKVFLNQASQRASLAHIELNHISASTFSNGQFPTASHSHLEAFERAERAYEWENRRWERILAALRKQFSM